MAVTVLCYLVSKNVCIVPILSASWWSGGIRGYRSCSLGIDLLILDLVVWCITTPEWKTDYKLSLCLVPIRRAEYAFQASLSNNLLVTTC